MALLRLQAGGGGIPVIDQGDGTHTGVLGAVDKDYAACVLAQELHADLFVHFNCSRKSCYQLWQKKIKYGSIK